MSTNNRSNDPNRPYCMHCGGCGYVGLSRTDVIIPLEEILEDIRKSNGWMVLEKQIDNYYKHYTAVNIKAYCRYCNKVPPNA